MGSGRWDKDEAGEHLYQAAYYLCPECGHPWDDPERWAAVKQGEWRATAPFHGIAGLPHLGGLLPLGEARRDGEGLPRRKGSSRGAQGLDEHDARRDVGRTGRGPDWQRLYERRRQELRLGDVPEWVGVLTAGADVQRNRIEVDVWGWGDGMQSALVDHRSFTAIRQRKRFGLSWTHILAEEWGGPGKRRLRIARMAIDTGDGYSTTSVYAWARRHPRTVMAVKGTGRFDASSPVAGPTWTDVTIGGRKLRRGVQLWMVAVSVFKSETYAWLRLDQPLDGQPFPPGYIHLPQGTTEEWIQQLVAEQLVKIKNRAGFSRLEWQKVRERNEAIDMRVYARAAAYAIGIDRWTDRNWSRARGDLSRAITDAAGCRWKSDLAPAQSHHALHRPPGGATTHSRAGGGNGGMDRHRPDG
jgi:phage terminase large subunit GpA-like protein